MLARPAPSLVASVLGSLPTWNPAPPRDRKRSFPGDGDAMGGQLWGEETCGGYAPLRSQKRSFSGLSRSGQGQDKDNGQHAPRVVQGQGVRPQRDRNYEVYAPPVFFHEKNAGKIGKVNRSSAKDR